MKKISFALLATAVGIAGAIQPASATRTKVYTISIDGFCNVETVTIQRGTKGNTILETGDGCDENFGAGLYTKIKGSGSFANFSWTSANSPGVTIDMVFTKPFATDGTGQVSLYYTQDGVNQGTIGPYTYEVIDGPARPNKTGMKPITSLIPRK
ncbi:MAG TPA: hypothetical protein VHE09_01255 [Rhizomicrobium sp.]|jgi:hypothetical protein|nr:hypothetical protein [Rhizomicrobium sp.]